MNKKAFTLVELLVVISIIALLLMVLMPSLGKAREMARTVVCSTNMRSLGTSWHAYATDNNGRMISAMTEDVKEFSESTHSAEFEHTKYSWVCKPYDEENDSTPRNTVGTVIEIPIEHRQAGIEQGKLYSYSQDVAVFRCPSEKSKFGHFRGYSIADGMYGEMAYIPKDIAVQTPFRWKSHTNVAQVKQPSSKYVFVEDSEPRPYNEGSWKPVLSNDKTNPYIEYDPMAIRHSNSRRSCFAFADGHVSQKSWSDEVSKDFEEFRKAGNYKDFTKYGPKSDEGKEDIKWLYNGFSVETWY